MNRKTLGKTYERLKTAKACGISAAEAWRAIRQGVEQTDMRPSAKAMTLGAAWEYLVEIYGVEETKDLRKFVNAQR
jgi:hypothetical protein